MSYIPDVEPAEVQDLREVVRSILQKRSSSEDVRRAFESSDGFDRDLWVAFAEEIGLQGLAISESHGGAGASLRELIAVQEELGRCVIPSPYFSTVVLFATLITETGNDSAAAELLPRVAAGELIGAVAIADQAVVWDAARSRVTAGQSDDGAWSLTGTAPNVLDAAVADAILVPALVGDGVGIFLVESGVAGLEVAPLQTLDLTRRQAELRFDQVSARRLDDASTTGRDAVTALNRTLRLGALALVAEQVGGAEHLMELSVDYARNRYQFGRAIGSFQAIKHKLADMAFDLERMKAAIDEALKLSLADEDEDATQVAVSVAKAFCSEAYFRIAAETIQIHGGIGFTWEHDAHLYFRRAKTTGLLLGQAHEHREHLVKLLIDQRTSSAPQQATG